jgi:putative nucleotidyltransferase with HDIG domain
VSRIIIAENDGAVRGALVEWLEAAGYPCTPAETGTALAEARRQSPSAAIVGVATPEDGGMWVVRMLRNQPTPVPVVVMSATHSFDVAVAASRLGVTDCLAWPASQESVVEAIARCVRWRRSAEAATEASRRLAEEVAIGRDRLVNTLERVDPKMTQSVLLGILESKAPDTFDHSHRVGQSSVALARSHGLSPAEIRDVRCAALLHDIGKVAIPHRLISTAGPLTDAEIAVLRMHVVIGAEVLATVPGHQNVATLIGSSHEHYNGGGYPHGRVGTDIPIGARIIAVADAYDAMTSRRTYSDPVSHDDANAELVRTAGTYFDPDLIRSWMQMTELAQCS